MRRRDFWRVRFGVGFMVACVDSVGRGVGSAILKIVLGVESVSLVAWMSAGWIYQLLARSGVGGDASYRVGRDY